MKNFLLFHYLLDEPRSVGSCSVWPLHIVYETFQNLVSRLIEFACRRLGTVKDEHPSVIVEVQQILHNFRFYLEDPIAEHRSSQGVH